MSCFKSSSLLFVIFRFRPYLFVINVSINNCNEVSQRVGSPNKTMASILGKKSELELDCNPYGIAERKAYR